MRGIDIPAVDTILLLRPTESATVFLQQLGRGLRWTEGKSVLTVLDFIGQAHANYNSTSSSEHSWRHAANKSTRRPRRLSAHAARDAQFGSTRCHRRSF